MTTREEKYEYESAVATSLFQLIGLPYTSMTDPWKTHGGETGADVEIHYDGRRIGIQETKFSVDEGAVPPKRGLRAATARNAALGKLTSGCPPLRQQVPALVLRIREKIAKARRYDFKQFDEVWLLVATFVPWAPVPTFQLPDVTITPEDLNCHLNNELRRSNFTRAFVYNMLCHTVYEWQSATGWRYIHESRAARASTNGELWFKRYLADPEIRKDPKGWALREAQRVLQELRSGSKSTPHEDGRRRGGYIMKTGKPRWSVGCIQNGPMHDAGLRWFVCERASGAEQAVAYTEEREQAEMIVASLEQTE